MMQARRLETKANSKSSAQLNASDEFSLLMQHHQ